ncbi:hypothetical protein ACA910_009690 [Epithemia clementina (nom. ined.)]
MPSYHLFVVFQTWETSYLDPNVAKINDSSRFWTFCLSYDPGFLKALERRMFGLIKDRGGVSNGTMDNTEDDAATSSKSTLHFLDLLSTPEGTRKF